MRNWIFAAVIGLATCGQAWAWDEDPYFLSGSLKRFDEIEAKYGPPEPPINIRDRHQVEMYLQKRQDYDEAVGRLQLDSQRRVEKMVKQQEEMLRRMEEKELWGDLVP